MKYLQFLTEKSKNYLPNNYKLAWPNAKFYYYKYPKTDRYEIVNHIPVYRPNGDIWTEYENKPLSEWDADNFSSFVFDKLDSQGILGKGDTFIHNVEFVRKYIDALKVNKEFQRVYLYGVFQMIKPVIHGEDPFISQLKFNL